MVTSTGPRGVSRKAEPLYWGNTAEGMKVVKLSKLMLMAIPPLFVCSLPKNARGFSFERGEFGAFVGSILFSSSLIIGYLLSGAVGILAYPFSLWLLGATGVLMIYNSAGRSIAFVKPLCTTCRLLPIIQEHEALHLAGLDQDSDVWNLMRQRYSWESLSLDGDPTICSFCPIPKRLKEH